MRYLAFLLGLALVAPSIAVADDEAAWKTLAAGGHVLLVRHATTDPGVGDPPGYTLADCASQRVLSADGRRQARAFGERLTARGVSIGPVLTSRFCRCVDTATLAFGRADAWTPLDSVFDARDAEPARTRAVRDRIAAWRGPGTLVLVTHGANIAAYVGAYVAMGEGVVVDRQARVVGRIAPAR
jgi:broad specificity phosphatase PhoE